MREILKKLLNTYGATGREDAIRRTIREMVEPYVDEIEEDALGNLICIRRDKGRRHDPESRKSVLSPAGRTAAKLHDHGYR